MSFNVIDILFADSQEEGACKTGHGNKMVQARMAWKVSAPQDIEKDASSNQQHGQQAEKYIYFHMDIVFSGGLHLVSLTMGIWAKR